MRVRISYVVDVDCEYRRAINHYSGRPGLATREEVKSWFRDYGGTMSGDLFAEHQGCCFKEDG